MLKITSALGNDDASMRLSDRVTGQMYDCTMLDRVIWQYEGRGNMWPLLDTFVLLYQ